MSSSPESSGDETDGGNDDPLAKIAQVRKEYDKIRAENDSIEFGFEHVSRAINAAAIKKNVNAHHQRKLIQQKTEKFRMKVFILHHNYDRIPNKMSRLQPQTRRIT